jgi:hypothetical protein
LCGAGVGKTVLIQVVINNAKVTLDFSIRRVGERTREEGTYWDVESPGIIKYGDEFMHWKMEDGFIKVDMPGMRVKSYFRFRTNEWAQEARARVALDCLSLNISVMEQEQIKGKYILSWIIYLPFYKQVLSFGTFRSYAICSRLPITLATEMGAMQSVLHPNGFYYI